MAETFFDRPILNSPYEEPAWHHVLDPSGQPLECPPAPGRRRSELITPVPRPRKLKARARQGSLALSDAEGLSSVEQAYNPTPIIGREAEAEACGAEADGARAGAGGPGDRLPAGGGLPGRAADERLRAEFSEDSRLVLTPEEVGPCTVLMEGIVGQGVELNAAELEAVRPSTIVFGVAEKGAQIRKLRLPVLAQS